MLGITFRAVGLVIFVSAGLCQSAQAQNIAVTPRQARLLPGDARAKRLLSNQFISQMRGTRKSPAPGRLRHHGMARPVHFTDGRVNSARSSAIASGTNSKYPYLNAPLYPSPRQDIPHQVGGTVITNQAFAPHEMLHPHTYRAIYPPFYYKVSGGWMVTPWGVWSRDKWELQGTEVEVKYRSSAGILRRLFR